MPSLAFILTAQMFRAMNPSLEEAAKVHGMGFGGTFRRITLPLAMPGILAAVIYIVTIGLATFDIPAILGLGNRVYMLSTFIYLKVHPQGSGLPEYGITGAVGVFMIAIAGLLTLWYGQVLNKAIASRSLPARVSSRADRSRWLEYCRLGPHRSLRLYVQTFAAPHDRLCGADSLTLRRPHGK